MQFFFELVHFLHEISQKLHYFIEFSTIENEPANWSQSVYEMQAPSGNKYNPSA
jgi:hypothetical protein